MSHRRRSQTLTFEIVLSHVRHETHINNDYTFLFLDQANRLSTPHSTLIWVEKLNIFFSDSLVDWSQFQYFAVFGWATVPVVFFSNCAYDAHQVPKS